ncbi:nuclear transcription factor Y subunit C-1-like [Lycium barbarum]|uniref:nuclear transcription factor Y subunit C-1-like n=1 Tax=Lycium barbarum TaxID=112863 RepID=UPI00293ECAA5|nr:nuclear transcription factor Y subunit C-1-like [Lycium barbarum]XP_060204405.1 nuclear transcription factor Y subunit C-1-like [Lycium barbarum]XP_060204406.1 nuclear transcription factor Y subunit C-1-like [Lycium barbarum]XP_060204407.1 nuclear transcription factor Y subunit C-1-like [Lycium barbarum]XP_060204408.1 nuclear transcription factor Y subunit C-1-like [Lycium barbarum]XP_060204409.1 nuclear transcription factor Y subunit C-1-like [Lycium barbarum]XP_060204410.1 nuclear transc
MENNPDQSAAAAEESYDSLLDKQEEQLEMFWNYQRQEIENVNDFKNQQLPLARIKKVMKSDEDVRMNMISAEAPIFLAKACELFILELTIRSWLRAEENNHRILQKSDIETAIAQDDTFDFLFDVIHEEGAMLQPAVDPSMYVQPPPSQACQSVCQAASGQGNLDDQS